MEVMEKLTEANKLLDELEIYFDELPGKQSRVDSELSDLYHYIENNSLNASQSCKIVKQIKAKRLERRQILKDFELSKVYKTNSNKLSSKENRKFLFNDLNKTIKSLDSEYKNRIYTQEQLDTLNFQE